MQVGVSNADSSESIRSEFPARLGIGNHVNSTVYNEPSCMHFGDPRALKKNTEI